MLFNKEKELLFVHYGLTFHKPEANEALILGGVIAVICIALNFRFPSPVLWSLIAVVSICSAVFDLVPPQKPLRTLLISLIAGAGLAFVATL